MKGFRVWRGVWDGVGVYPSGFNRLYNLIMRSKGELDGQLLG